MTAAQFVHSIPLSAFRRFALGTVSYIGIARGVPKPNLGAAVSTQPDRIADGGERCKAWLYFNADAVSRASGPQSIPWRVVDASQGVRKHSCTGPSSRSAREEPSSTPGIAVEVSLTVEVLGLQLLLSLRILVTMELAVLYQ